MFKKLLFISFLIQLSVAFSQVTISITDTKDESCLGASDGSITVELSGGTAPYQVFAYRFGGFTIASEVSSNIFLISNLSAPSFYIIEAVDDLGVQGFQTQNIAAGTVIDINGSVTAETCEGFNDGTISVNPSGGVIPYDILWNDGRTTSSIVDLSDGNYTVTVTDDNNCSVDSSFVIDKGFEITAKIFDPPATDCENQTFIITDGSSGPIDTYDWDFGLGAVPSTANTAGPHSLNYSSPGIKSIRLIVSSSGECPDTATTILDVLEIPSASAIAGSTTCVGGTAEFMISGTPNATVSYSIDGAAVQSIVLSSIGAATINVNGVLANTTLNLSLIDDGTCSKVLSEAVTVIVNPSPFATVTNGSNVCAGQDASFEIAGTANAIVTYSLDGVPTQTVTLDGAGVAIVIAPAVISNTTITLSLVDDGVCTTVLTGTATVIVNPVPTASVSAVADVCEGGDAVFEITGTPNADVDYNINGGANQSVTLGGSGSATITEAVVTTNTVINLTLVDNGSCTDVLTATSTVTVFPIPAASVAAGADVCSNGDAVFTITGTANAVVTYNIGGTAAQTVILDASGRATVAESGVISATTINLTLVDNGLCTDVLVETATVNLRTSPTASVLAGAAICENQDASFEIAGTANAIVTYSLDGVPTQTVTLDGAGVAIVTAPSVTTNSTITLSLVDDGVCTTVLTGTATVIVNPVPTASVSAVADVCEGGDAIFEIVGTPNADVDYNINGGANQSITLDGVGSATITEAVVTTNTVINLTLVDNGSCTDVLTSTSTVTVFPIPTAAVAAGADVCSNGDAVFTITGTANAVVTYNIGGTAAQTVKLDAGGTATVTESGVISATTINLTLVDNGLCTDVLVETATVGVNPLPSVVLSPDTFNLCVGDTASFVATGGDSHSWSPLSNIDGSNTANPRMYPTSSTVYYDTVRTSFGCQLIDSVFVDVKPLPIVKLTSDQPICTSDTLDLVAISEAGATFSWSSTSPISDPFNDTIRVTPDLTTTYTVTVTNSFLCENRDEVTLDARPKLDGILTTTADTLCYGNSATITATFNGGFVPDMTTGGYSFDGGQTFQTNAEQKVDGLISGVNNYNVVLRDGFGCLSDTLKDSVLVLEQLAFNIDTIVEPDCASPVAGEFHVNSFEGGFSSYQVSVNSDIRNNVNSSDNLVFDNLPIDIYNITVVDGFGCQETRTINYQSAFVLDTVIGHVSCFGQDEGLIILEATSGGTAPYTYSFNGGVFETFAIYTDLIAGTYNVIIKDDVGCEVPVAITILEPDEISWTLDNLLNESCPNSDDGELSLSITGGTPIFEFTLDTIVRDSSNVVFTDLSPGTDTVFVKDNNGCRDTIPFNIAPSEPVAVYLSLLEATDCRADDGSAIIDSIKGGSGNFSFSFDGGTSYKDSSSVLVDMASLSRGSYRLDVQDSVSGCFFRNDFGINAVGGLLIDSVKQVVSNESCVGGDGAIRLNNFLNAPGPFQFQLRDYHTDTLLVNFQNDSSFLLLDSNTYYVAIMDGTGCVYDMKERKVSETVFAATASSYSATCKLSNGSILVNTANGNAPYQFTLNDTLIQANGKFTDLASGNYSIKITDGSNPTCTDAINVNVGESGVDAIITTDSSLCSYSNEGEMRILSLFNADTSLYSYEFSVDNSGFTSDSVYSGLFADKHILNIKQTLKSNPDSSCIYRDREVYYDIILDTIFYDTLITPSFYVFAPDTMKAQTTSLPATRGEEDGAVGIYGLQGGSFPYSFTLESESSEYFTYNATDSIENYIDGIGEGDYFFSVVDNKGCEEKFPVRVSTEFYVPNVITPNGDGRNDMFKVSGLPDNSRFRVYDRWGSRVFYDEDYKNDWDGGVQKSGTYYFELETERYGTLKGWVQVIK